MDSSRRTAGLGLLAYGIGTSVAFMSIDAAGGDYDDGVVTAYMSSDHRITAFALAYLGAFATLGLLPFASRMRSELRSGGDLFWGLTVAGTAAAVIGWFLLGGIAVVFAEGGSALTALPHTVMYALSELSILVTVGASAFLVGSAALVSGRPGAAPHSAARPDLVAGGVRPARRLLLHVVPLLALGDRIRRLGARHLGSARASRRPAQHQPA